MPIRVNSETGYLRAVLLHRPGKELESLTPQYLDSMLFEDIPYLEQMQDEHDRFASLLSSHGCSVYYVQQLLEHVLSDTGIRARVTKHLVDSAHLLSPSLCEVILGYLDSLDSADLAACCVEGLLKSTIEDRITRKDLSFHIRDAYPYYIAPLPNLYFTRDPATVINGSLLVHELRTESRKRESHLFSLIAQNHPLFADVRIHAGYTEGRSIEGGDILVLDSSSVIVGCSARTEVWAIEAFARRMLAPEEAGGGGLRDILVIQIPFTRAYMHLDTVFTMVDRDKFSIYGGIRNSLRIFRMTAGTKGDLSIEEEEDLARALKLVLDIPSVDLIESGGGDPIVAVREQWNDSTNTLAIAPGKVVTYRRNTVSNETLQRHGITVLPISGSELVRGRGGPRCMSMPLWRDKA